MKLRITCWCSKALRQPFRRLSDRDLVIENGKIEPCFLIHAITSFLCCANS